MTIFHGCHFLLRLFRKARRFLLPHFLRPFGGLLSFFLPAIIIHLPIFECSNEKNFRGSLRSIFLDLLGSDYESFSSLTINQSKNTDEPSKLVRIETS